MRMALDPRLTSPDSAPAGSPLRGKGGHTPGSVSSVLCVTLARCWGVARGASKGDLDDASQKDLKRLVRARMKKTGEAYTAAREQILTKGKSPRSAPADAAPRATTSPALVTSDYAQDRRNERRGRERKDGLHVGHMGRSARPLRRRPSFRTARSRSSSREKFKSAAGGRRP